MAANFMAYPELRHPFEPTDVHAAGHTTILYQGRTITLDYASADTTLLVHPQDLVRINGFELKPEGACFESLCIAVNTNLLVTVDGVEWLDLLAFADLLEQPYVGDPAARVWSFAEIPAKRENMMVNAMAPDIELKDRQGNIVRLADLKGKKALIVTWSSW